MKNKIIGKAINEFTGKTYDMPDYVGTKFWISNPVYKYVKCNGQFIANRYNSILEIIKETKATVKITKDEVLVNYPNGSFKIGRDQLVNKFLIPALNTA